MHERYVADAIKIEIALAMGIKGGVGNVLARPESLLAIVDHVPARQGDTPRI